MFQSFGCLSVFNSSEGGGEGNCIKLNLNRTLFVRKNILKSILSNESRRDASCTTFGVVEFTCVADIMGGKRRITCIGITSLYLWIRSNDEIGQRKRRDGQLPNRRNESSPTYVIVEKPSCRPPLLLSYLLQENVNNGPNKTVRSSIA